MMDLFLKGAGIQVEAFLGTGGLVWAGVPVLVPHGGSGLETNSDDILIELVWLGSLAPPELLLWAEETKQR